jgi:hypothetical protein
VSKRVAGCTAATLGIYSWWLRRVLAESINVTPLTMHHCLGDPGGWPQSAAASDLGNEESHEAWLAMLRDLVRRGMRTPVSITSDGASGWSGRWRKFPCGP